MSKTSPPAAPQPTSDQLRARLVGLLDRYNITRAKLASRLGIRRPTVNARLNGETKTLPVEMAIEMAHAIVIGPHTPVETIDTLKQLVAAELLTRPIVSEQYKRVLRRVKRHHSPGWLSAVSTGRLEHLLAEGLIEADAERDYVLTQAGEDWLAGPSSTPPLDVDAIARSPWFLQLRDQWRRETSNKKKP